MTTVSHEPSAGVQEREGWWVRILVTEMWASLAIIVIWLSVLADAIFGPDIVTSNGVGDIGEQATVPSAVVVSLFAFLATWVVAKYGFRHEREPD